MFSAVLTFLRPDGDCILPQISWVHPRPDSWLAHQDFLRSCWNADDVTPLISVSGDERDCWSLIVIVCWVNWDTDTEREERRAGVNYGIMGTALDGTQWAPIIPRAEWREESGHLAPLTRNALSVCRSQFKPNWFHWWPVSLDTGDHWTTGQRGPLGLTWGGGGS